MGRRRLELKKIENNSRRHASFSKRCKGLLKKAEEVAVLCDVEVALVVFTPKGKLYDYSSCSSIEKTLERYQAHIDAEKQLTAWGVQQNNLDDLTEMHNWAGPLGESLKCLVESELQQVSLSKLQHLETDLDAALTSIRSKKTELMLDMINMLREKEKMLAQRKKDKKKVTLEVHPSNFLSLTLSIPCSQDRN